MPKDYYLVVEADLEDLVVRVLLEVLLDILMITKKR